MIGWILFAGLCSFMAGAIGGWVLFAYIVVWKLKSDPHYFDDVITKYAAKA